MNIQNVIEMKNGKDIIIVTSQLKNPFLFSLQNYCIKCLGTL